MRKIAPFIFFVIIGLLIVSNFYKGETEKSEEISSKSEKSPEETKEENETNPFTETEKKFIPPSRYSKIPNNNTKILPEDDLNPPVSESEEYFDPVPVPGLVNTPGGEDSAFILPSGEKLYFFFTPDVKVPVEKQVIDEVTGIYVSNLLDGEWCEPTRVLLQDHDKLAMDGCEVVIDDVMYFCTAREGFIGLHWFKARQINGIWSNWTCIDNWLKTFEYKVGELHFSTDIQTLYFHSDREGGKGGYDIWVSEWNNTEWGKPENLENVNSASYEGWPCLSPDETELWFSRDYGIWRSKIVDGEWSEPELMFFPLAGEPTVDSYGNVYFTHHFYDNDTMLEADIYVAYKK
jgi:hypothetical protein